MEEPGKSKKPLIVGIILLLIFAGLYVFVLSAYQTENDNRAAGFEPEKQKEQAQKAGENRIDVEAKIVTADPLKGDLNVRFEFTPHGSLAGPDGNPTQDLEFHVSSATGKNVHEFKKGKRMAPVEAVVEIYEGEPMDYPFDNHGAELSCAFAAPGGGEAVPMTIDVRGAVAGLRIAVEYAKESAPDHAIVDINIDRATTAKFFSVFIMIAMWGLTIGVLFLVFRVFTGQRKIEISMFSFLGALLFAFPALRNSQPGTPPIGTLSDFLAFFWAEVIIALSLLSVVLRWIIRGPGGDAPK